MAHAWLLLCASASALVAPVTRRATTPLQASTARDVLWTPNPDYVKTTAMDRFQQAMQIDGTYEQLWDWSVSEPDAFWTQLQDFLEVEREGSDTPARTGDTMPDVQWFPQSKLNFAENLLRHGKGPLANEEAVITVSEGMGRQAWTFAELRRDAGRVQRALSKLGVDSTQSCGAYVANVGEAVVAMLGATSTGATWTSCSPDFGARAVADGSTGSGPGRCSSRRTVLAAVSLCPIVCTTAPRASAGGHETSTRDHAGFVSMGKSTSTIDKVSELANSLPSVQKVVVISSSGNEFDASEWPSTMRDKVIGWADLLDGGDADPVFTRVPFSHPQFVLYSSGTTGMPKSIAHGCGNTLLQHGKELVLHGDLGKVINAVLHHLWLDDVELDGLLAVCGCFYCVLRRLRGA